MNAEQLQKVNELDAKIKNVESNLKHWIEAKGFKDQVTVRCYYDNGQPHSEWMDNNLIDFELLKTIQIAKLQKLLSEYKTEFDNS